MSVAATSMTGLLITGGVGLLTAIAAGVLTNWDKIFHKDKVVTGKVVGGYAPTGDFETEVRYYLEVSGMRANIAEMQKMTLAAEEKRLIEESPEDGAQIQAIIDIAEECMAPLEEFVKVLIPIWVKYLTLEQVQELNKFYSTEAMQRVRSKNTFVMEEFLPKATEIAKRYQERFVKRVEEYRNASERAGDA